MATPDSFEQKKVDPRIYLGILVFRWKLIVICFLYCLLGGVLYLQFAPKQYATSAAIMIYRDPSTQIDSQNYRWTESQTHVDLLESEGFQKRIVERLASRWLKRLGGNVDELLPNFKVSGGGRARTGRAEAGITMRLDVRNAHPAYARAFLREAVREFQIQRALIKQQSYGSATRILDEELIRLRDQIRSAEDDVIEFQRVNQMEYVQAKGSLELGYLNQLVGRQQQLSTEKWMLEVQYPKLKGQSMELIQSALAMTKTTGAIAPPTASTNSAEGAAGVKESEKTAAELDDGKSWQDARLKLARLEQQRKELAVYTQPGNPKLRALDDEIAAFHKDIDLQTDLQYSKVQERVAAISYQLDALDEAQRRWRSSYLMASKKTSELRQLQSAVTRLEMMHAQLQIKLSDMKVDQEIKGEHFIVVQPVKTDEKTVWPDPFKILIAVLVAGIGSGLGLAMVAYFFDDKVQSVLDVESAVGVPFLGGVPFWVHGDLANRVRPIVSDEHRSGAAEAYRALRTNVLSAVEKAGKKVVIITSADSKEGKTLTALNLSIMIAKTGKKVLLLDMDLRRGLLHKSFERERAPGIVDVLKEKRPLTDVIVTTSHENLWFAPAGSIDKNTSELLHSVDLEEFLAPLLEQYDYIFMDTAPVLRVTDTVILAGCPLVCVVYVAHANRTSKPTIKYSLDMLGDVHIIGMIVNSIDMHRISSLYYAYQYPNYAYYSYAYRYGYNYDLYDEHGRRTPMSPLGNMRRTLSRWFKKTFLPSE
ncbi:MAG: polysaccharide biosynthesis tyrosine autokinase [bacterium]